MFRVAREEHIWAQVFTRKLFPWWCQVFLFVHPFHLHVQYHMEELGIFLWRVTGIELWSERKSNMCEKEN